MEKPLKGSPVPRRLRYLVWLVIPLLLWWVLRSLQIERVVQAIAGLSWWQVGVFILTNTGLVSLFAFRWWLLVHRVHENLSVPRLAGYWLVGFGVDYSTPGPGIGGEPALATLLHERENIRAPAAAAAVGLDRLVDAAINFTVLFASALLIFRWHIFHHHILLRTILVPAAFLLTLGAAIAIFLRGTLPIAWIVNRLPQRFQHSTWLAFLMQSERRASRLLRDQHTELAWAGLISLLIWVGLFADFWLLVYFLGIPFEIPQLVTTMTAYRLAFLLPLPAGLGALEASQVFAYQVLGLDPTVALGAALLFRARDVLFASLGLVWGSWLIGGWSRLRAMLSGHPVASELD